MCMKADNNYRFLRVPAFISKVSPVDLEAAVFA